ncbi:microtubule organization protein AKNA-like [Limanda limanda]|uniref:microtubule organization protein AKNA-like n=1 Tax=Limanda limanda TaxID=27771 RepID=UPI0029C8DF06|nr:microtubule organization protein AKNA-like [Limanda limanda]
MDFAESPSQSCSSPISPRSSPQKSEEQEVKWPHSDTVGGNSLNSRPSTDRELRTPRARFRTAEVNTSRNVPVTYPTPDYSKVKPRVRLPTGDYKPPVSRRFSRRESLSFDTTYMSPADVVREVLLSTSDGSSDPSAPSSTVPQDFRCRQEAITLVEQLQEDHNTLLLEHALVNNTIDVLQMKAKMQSRLSHDTSEVMALDFPRAQRAEINSGFLHPDGHRAAPGPFVGEQLAKILHIQTDKFLQQLQIYEDLLKRKQLKPSEQIEGLSQLNERLNSLERGFLFAREEHKLLQQRGEDFGHFDQEQELGGLIFQCGMRIDELKEQVEGKRQGPPTCEAPPSGPPHLTPPSVPSDDWRWSVPQSPLVPLLVDPGSASELEVGRASEESDDEETDDEDTLKCQYLKPLTGKQRRDEQDFAARTDHYGSFQELPRTFDNTLREAEGENFHSCSLSSFGETPGSERRNSILQPGSSPGWSLERKLYQIRTAGLLVQSAVIRIPQLAPVLSTRGRLRGAESRETSWALSPKPKSRGRQRRRSSSCSPQRWVGQTERTRADRGARLERDSSEFSAAHTVSEDGYSDQSSTTAPRHQGNSPGALFSNAPRNLETNVPRLEERNKKTLSPVRAAPSALENHTPLYTSTPAPRSSYGSFQELPRTFDNTLREAEGERVHSSSLSSFGETPESERRFSNLQPGSSPGWCHLSRDGQRAYWFRALSSESPSWPQYCPPGGVSERFSPSGREHKETSDSLSIVSFLLTDSPTHKSRVQRGFLGPQPRTHEQRQTEEAQLLLLPTALVSAAHTVSEDGYSDQSSTTAQGHHGNSPGALFSNAPRNLETKVPRLEERNKKTLSPVRAAPSALENHTPLYTSTPAPRSRPVERCPSKVRKGRRERQKAEEVEESPAGGSSESTPTSSTSGSCQCPLYGCLQLNRDNKTDCDRDSAPRASCQSAESPDRAVRRTYHAAPAPSQCMLGSSPLLLVTHTPRMSLLPVHVSPSNSPGTPSGVRGHEETRSSSSLDEKISQVNSLNIFLDKADRMAKHMKRTGRHLAHSLTRAMQLQEQRTQSTQQTLASRLGSAADTQTE